jgi:hypothetical protein
MTTHDHHSNADQGEHEDAALTRTAIQATLHCLTGCAIGEILGMVIATALGLASAPTIVLSIVLAFTFGYGLTLRPVLRAGIPLRRALRLAFASDTVSIATMELSSTTRSSRSCRARLPLASPRGCSGGACSRASWSPSW